MKSWATKYFGNTWFPPCWPAKLHVVPKDGVIRAVAYEAVRFCRKSTPQIPFFSRILRSYISLITGCKDPWTVGEYVYRKLRAQVAEYRRKRWCLKDPLTRNDLLSAAMLILTDAERDIVQLAADGQVLKHAHPKGYLYVRVQLKEVSRQCFFTLGRPDIPKGRQILCLQTSDRFDRSMRRRQNPSRNDYRNYHPMSRH